MSVRESCSSFSRSIGEPLYGTAPQAQAWILLEQPGAWGPDAVFESALDPRVAAELNKRAAAMGARILMIRRRSGRYDSSELTAYIASIGAGAVWMEELKLSRSSDLLDVELETLTTPEPAGAGKPASEAYLVCTHGRRDPCCAEFGRALLGSMAALEAPVWESSHQGGHRFAANLACFPHGLFYGRVSRDEGPAIVDAHRRGDVHLPRLRGWSAYSSIVQSADHLVREETGITAIGGLSLERVSQDRGRAAVSFRSEAGTHRVEMELRIGEPRRESCLKDKLTRPEVWVRA